MYFGEQQVSGYVTGNIEIDLYLIFLSLQLEYSGFNYLILACLL